MCIYSHSGGLGGTGTEYEVLKFDPSTLSWSKVGDMVEARGFHGVSVVRAEDVEQFCG